MRTCAKAHRVAERRLVPISVYPGGGVYACATQHKGCLGGKGHDGRETTARHQAPNIFRPRLIRLIERGLLT
jgi:hypothetical protein